MASDNLKETIEQINKQGEMKFFDGATDEQIATRENCSR